MDGLGLVLQEVDLLVTRVVVDEHDKVLLTAGRHFEWPRDVGVDMSWPGCLYALLGCANLVALAILQCSQETPTLRRTLSSTSIAMSAGRRVVSMPVCKRRWSTSTACSDGREAMCVTADGAWMVAAFSIRASTGATLATAVLRRGSMFQQ